MKRRPRALIATRVHLPEPTAASQRWEAVERALVAAGFQVEVLTSRYSKAASTDSGEVVVKRWPTLRDSAGNLRGYIPYLSFDVPLFFRILAARRPDLILVEPPPTTGLAVRAASALRGVPYLWYAADTWSSGARSMGAPFVVVRLLEWAESVAISGAEAVVAVTEGVEARVREMGGKPVFLVPNGIDTDIYRPETTSASSLDLVDPYFIYGGTASEFQGAVVFIDAFEQILREHPRLQLLFVGNGAQWEEIKRKAQAVNDQYPGLPPRVIAQETLPPEAVAPLISQALAALVSVVPAHGADTPYPTKILAALACGTPVIFLGDGQPQQDISAKGFGVATAYGIEQAEQALRQILVDGVSASREEMRQWVIAHRSLQQTGQGVLAAVDYVLQQSTKLRLTIATRVFAPDSGAASARLQTLTERVASQFRQVSVVTTKPYLSEPVDFPPNVDIRRAPVLRAPDGAVRGYFEYLSYDIPLFFRLLTAPKSDVVLCEPPPTTGLSVRMASALRRTPYVYYAGDLLGDAAAASQVNPLVVAGVSLIEKIALTGASAIVTVNERVAERIQEIARVPAQVLPAGVALPALSELRKKPALWPVGSGPVFVYAGTVTDWMGAELFIEAAPAVFAEFPDAKLIFVGGGMGWQELEKRVRTLGDERVMMVSAVSVNEARLWQASATACLASLLPGPYDLAYTTKAVTSWSVGTPVVYAGVGPAARDIRKYRLGKVAEPSASDVARAMIEVARIQLTDPEAFSRRRLRAWVRQHHGADKWAAKMGLILDHVGRRGKSASDKYPGKEWPI